MENFLAENYELGTVKKKLNTKEAQEAELDQQKWLYQMRKSLDTLNGITWNAGEFFRLLQISPLAYQIDAS